MYQYSVAVSIFSSIKTQFQRDRKSLPYCLISVRKTATSCIFRQCRQWLSKINPSSHIVCIHFYRNECFMVVDATFCSEREYQNYLDFVASTILTPSTNSSSELRTPNLSDFSRIPSQKKTCRLDWQTSNETNLIRPLHVPCAILAKGK